MVHVLEIKGKHESVDNVVLHNFNSVVEAQHYINEHSHPTDKYFSAMSIIEPEREYEVCGSRGEEYPADIY